jgi:hypothetical protein
MFGTHVLSHERLVDSCEMLLQSDRFCGTVRCRDHGYGPARGEVKPSLRGRAMEAFGEGCTQRYFAAKGLKKVPAEGVAMKHWVLAWAVGCVSLLTSCAGSAGGGLPSSVATATRVTGSAGGAAAAVVSNEYNLDTGAKTGLLLFGASGGVPLATISTQAVPLALVAEPNGGYFALMYPWSIVEYSGGGDAVRTLGGLTAPGSMAVDSSGNLYVVDARTAVKEFAPAATSPTRTAATGSNLAKIAVDATGRLYVASSPRSPGTHYPGSVSEYLPGSTTPSTVVVPSKGYVGTIATDPHRPLLYAIDGGVVKGDVNAETISVYRAGATTPIRVVPVTAAVAMTVGSNGDVYVLINTGRNAGRIEILAPKLTKSLKTFAATMNSPLACGADPMLSVDALGDAYVVDCQNLSHSSGVTHEYSPNGRLLRDVGGLGNNPTGAVVLQ